MEKIDITTHTLTRDGTFLKVCLTQTLPFVKKALVALDSRSGEQTRQELDELQKLYSNLEVTEYIITEPFTDLVKAKNSMIKQTQTKWFWILDDDDYYPPHVIERIDKILADDNMDIYKGFSLKCWAVLGAKYADKISSWARHEKIFKTTNNIQYVGIFGKERMYDGEEWLWSKINHNIPTFIRDRYIHLTHLKKSEWREEMGQYRKKVGSELVLLPTEITNLLNKII